MASQLPEPQRQRGPRTDPSPRAADLPSHPASDDDAGMQSSRESTPKAGWRTYLFVVAGVGLRPVAHALAEDAALAGAVPVAAKLGRICDALDKRGVAEVHLQPSCGLEFLPRDRAKRKLERMREIRDAAVKAGA